jgi:hypothetical protein
MLGTASPAGVKLPRSDCQRLSVEIPNTGSMRYAGQMVQRLLLEMSYGKAGFGMPRVLINCGRNGTTSGENTIEH